MKKALKIIGKTIAIALASVFALVTVVLGGLNFAKFILYSDYYSIETALCKNPGIHDGFVCQGIAAVEEEGKILVAGYMNDKSNSRIYVTDLDSNSYYVSLERDGKKYTGHAGGIATTGDNVYLANGSKIYTFPLESILSAKNGDVVDIGSGTEVNNNASFVYTDEQYLYVGEFHDGGKYVTDHIYETEDGTYHAIISRYLIDDLSAPDKIYSVRNKVQGACFTPDGKVVLSTSYGLSDTVYYVYDEADATPSGETLDGAPVYYLDDLKQEIHGPAMGEDLDYSGGKVITLTESASDKYIFGNFFFAYDIVSLDI